jgi:hypothetical protein
VQQRRRINETHADRNLDERVFGREGVLDVAV